MPRSRITSANASCSDFARLTQSTSSNSSSSAFDGVRRVCSKPGRWTMTLRSFPTSECTPNAIIASSLVASRPFPTRLHPNVREPLHIGAPSRVA